jgi:hypothetical protein
MWQRLCRLLFTWQAAKGSLPTNSLQRVLYRLPRGKESAKPLLPVLGPLPTAKQAVGKEGHSSSVGKIAAGFIFCLLLFRFACSLLYIT